MSYVMTCLWGYRNFGFDSKQLLHAIDESKKETVIMQKYEDIKQPYVLNADMNTQADLHYQEQITKQ